MNGMYDLQGGGGRPARLARNCVKPIQAAYPRMRRRAMARKKKAQRMASDGKVQK